MSFGAEACDDVLRSDTEVCTRHTNGVCDTRYERAGRFNQAPISLKQAEKMPITNFSRLRMDYKDRIAQCEGDCLPKDNGSLGKR